MKLDPRTPVLVGLGSVTQRSQDPARAKSAVELMVAAAEQAAEDTGRPALGRRTSLVMVPRGTWSHPNPAQVVAEHLGATGARTVLSELGVLQQSLITEACRAISEARSEVVVICGGEDRYRARLAGLAGVPLETRNSEPRHISRVEPPDRILSPQTEIVTRLEVERDLVIPARQYAVIDSALRRPHHQSIDQRRRMIAAQWASFAQIAAGTDGAWDQSAPTAEHILTPSTSNRVIAHPYTKLMCSQWNVDQAAGLVIASAEAAASAGVPRDRWLFPLAAAESNLVIPLPERPELDRWPAFASCWQRASLLARIRLEDLGPIDLYSCFPSAVAVQAAELGLEDASTATVTGGMTFGGGPFNNYVLQSTVAVARRLRQGQGGTGLVSCVSGLLSKPGVLLWSATPRPGGFRASDTSAEDARSSVRRRVDADATGEASVVGYTVVYEGQEPQATLAVLETAEQTRTIATCQDASVARAMTTQEWVGRKVDLYEPGRFS